MRKHTRQIIKIPIKPFIKYLILLLLLGLAGSCKCQKKMALASAPSNQKNVLTLVMTDNYGGTEEEELQVIRTAGALQKVFAKINRTRKPGLTVPEIDFEHYMALVYSPGKMRDTILPILYQIPDTEGRFIVGVKKETSQKESDSSAVIVPFMLYTIPATEQPVRLSGHP